MTADIYLKKEITRVKLVPPDGGWGWMVLFGTSLANIVNQSMLSSIFSLLFGDQVEVMGYQTKGATVIVGVRLFVANFEGPIAGAILKLTSPRFVAVTGACFCSLGIFLSGFATNITHLIITYGLIFGIGQGFLQISSFVALNSYFKVKKSRVLGFSKVITAMGNILVPHVIRYLLENYGFRSTCMMLAGLSLHGICGTLLIQPVEWHMKKNKEEVQVNETLLIVEEKLLKKDIDDKNSVSKKNGQIDVVQEKKKSLLRKIGDRFDVNLLSSPRFLNIIIGTALAMTSIQNFSFLYPLFLQKEASLDKHQTAMCISAVTFGDIAGRIVLPMFQDKYQIKARWMLIGTFMWIIVIRQTLAYQVELTVLLVLSCLYGFSRSTVIVSRNIAMSENCRMDQVPAAVGLGMLSIGIIVPPGGILLGWIRDYTESYVVCITVQNFLLIVLLVLWIPDMLYTHIQQKKKACREIKIDLQLQNMS